MRRLLPLLLCFATFLFSTRAHAGSYLDRAALLLEQARKEGDMLGSRTKDTEFVSLVRALAEARSKAAKKMSVPPAVAKVHPHLLLCLESYDRAFLAAEQGNAKKSAEHLATAREEERIYKTLLGQAGFTLPDLKKP